MTIDHYYVQQDDGYNEDGPFDTYCEAKEEARKISGMVICYEFEYSDSYMVDDFRTTGDES